MQRKDQVPVENAVLTTVLCERPPCNSSQPTSWINKSLSPVIWKESKAMPKTKLLKAASKKPEKKMTALMEWS